MAVIIEVSTVKETAFIGSLSFESFEINSATKCWESAAEPPLPATYKQPPFKILWVIFFMHKTTLSFNFKSKLILLIFDEEDLKKFSISVFKIIFSYKNINNI